MVKEYGTFIRPTEFLLSQFIDSGWTAIPSLARTLPSRPPTRQHCNVRSKICPNKTCRSWISAQSYKIGYQSSSCRTSRLHLWVGSNQCLRIEIIILIWSFSAWSHIWRTRFSTNRYLDSRRPHVYHAIWNSTIPRRRWERKSSEYLICKIQVRKLIPGSYARSYEIPYAIVQTSTKVS